MGHKQLVDGTMDKSRRFVILHHVVPGTFERPSHWDVMFENGDELQTWALNVQPAHQVVIQATALPEHRKKYLDYEGEISHDRGVVRRWDSGQIHVVESSSEKICVRIMGRRLFGKVELVRDLHDAWTFVYSEESSDGNPQKSANEFPSDNSE